MDRSIPVFNRYLHEKWSVLELQHHRHRMSEIHSKGFATSIPSQQSHEKKVAIQKNIYRSHSRKHQLSVERKREIEKRNQELYSKMSVIFKNGGGHVAPLKNKTQRPDFEFSQISQPRPGSRQPDFGNIPGHNLVVNRRSLGVESKNMTQERIKDSNLKFLRRL